MITRLKISFYILMMFILACFALPCTAVVAVCFPVPAWAIWLFTGRWVYRQAVFGMLDLIHYFEDKWDELSDERTENRMKLKGFKPFLDNKETSGGFVKSPLDAWGRFAPSDKTVKPWKKR